MPSDHDTHDTAQTAAAADRTRRRLSMRAAALLAALTLGVGVAVGAAIGPAPESSLAGGDVSQLLGRLGPLLAMAGGHGAQTAAAPAPASSVAAKAPTTAATAPTPAVNRSAPAQPAAEPERETPPAETAPAGPTSALPPIADVWLIELSGTSLEGALAQPTAAPYIDGTLVPAGTLLEGWSALQGSALASLAAAAQTPAPGTAPPLLRSIVQPPCPEGDAECAPQTPGQLKAADEFLQTTLAQITNTPAYREHGLVVVTFATVGIAAQAGLPAGASLATLTYQPPAGVAVMSPFARPGARSAAKFDPTSPVRSLQALLRR